MLQVEGWTQSSPRRKLSPQKPCAEGEPTGPATATMPDSPEVLEEESMSALASPFPVSQHLGPRQRTHSAPGPHPSSLSRLLAQGTPPIEEVTEGASPSPPHSSQGRPASPLARPSSPLARAPSPLTRPSPSLTGKPHKRHSSPLVSPPHSRPSSPLAGPSAQHPRPSSPLAGPSYSQPSPPLTSHAHGRPSSPLVGASYAPPSSPLAGPSRPQPPSPLATSQPPVQPSPQSTTSALYPSSRRSSSSSRPSTSSIFSNRHPFTLSSSPAKASPTTALTDPSVTVLVSGISSRAHDELATQRPATPSPEGSPSEGLSNIFHARRRTTSASTSSSRLSPLAGPGNSRTQTSHGPAQGALASLANSWGFVRKGSASARHTIRGETSRSTQGSGTTSTSPPRVQKPASSEILRRYDDILPQERGSR